MVVISKYCPIWTALSLLGHPHPFYYVRLPEPVDSLLGRLICQYVVASRSGLPNLTHVLTADTVSDRENILGK